MLIKPYTGSLMIFLYSTAIEKVVVKISIPPANLLLTVLNRVFLNYCTSNRVRTMPLAKILWVDDEIESLQSQRIFLENKGYEVNTLTNGFDAVEYVKDNPV